MSVADGIYTISPYVDKSKNVNIPGSRTSNGINAILYPDGDGNNERFYISNKAPIDDDELAASDGSTLVTSANDTLSVFLKKGQTTAYYHIVAQHGSRDLALATYDSSPAAGGRVCQWKETSAAWDSWYVTDTGERVTADGVQNCPVVKIWRDKRYTATGQYDLYLNAGRIISGQTAYLTVDPDLTVLPNYGERYENYQKWVLRPVAIYYANGPSLSAGGFTVVDPASIKNFSSSMVYTAYSCVPHIFPAFRVPASWAAYNTYSFTYSYRYKSSKDSKWSSWSNWMPWSDYDTSQGTLFKTDSGELYAVLRPYNSDGTYGIPAMYSWSKAKYLQLYIKVAAVGYFDDASGDQNLYSGPTYGYLVDIPKKPEVNFTSVGYTPSGLLINYESDYPTRTVSGTLNLTFKKIESLKKGRNKSVELNIQKYNLDERGYIFLSTEEVGWFYDKEPIRIHYQIGNDQWEMQGGVHTSDNIVLYDNSSGVFNIVPKISFLEYGVAVVTFDHPNDGSVVGWIASQTYTAIRMIKKGTVKRSDTVSRTTFYAIPPLFESFEFFLGYANSATDIWATDVTVYEKGTPEWEEYRSQAGPSHMFITDDNKMAVLHMTKGKYTLTEKESVSATYREDAVDAREYQTVRVAETKKATFTAEGVLADGYTDFTVDQFRDLVGETVLYRGPRGYFYQVVITSVTFDTPVNIDPPVTTVKVSLIRISK